MIGDEAEFHEFHADVKNILRGRAGICEMLDQQFKKRAFAAATYAGDKLYHRFSDKRGYFVKIASALKHLATSAQKDSTIVETFLIITQTFDYSRSLKTMLKYQQVLEMETDR